MADPHAKSTAIIVLGPYRSGTSVTSQVLAALGVNFGPKRHFVPANHQNPGGFYERKDINAANEALIDSVGKNLADPGDPRDLARRCDVKAFELADMGWRETSPAWGIKDPRMCATLLAWIERGPLANQPLKIIQVRRKLDGSVKSAMAFDSVRLFCDGTEAGVRAMLDRYAQLAQWHVDVLDQPSFSFDYEQLIREPEAVVAQLADFLNVKDVRAIRRATGMIGKGKGTLALQVERYLLRAPRRLYYLLTGRNRDGTRKAQPEAGSKQSGV